MSANEKRIQRAMQASLRKAEAGRWYLVAQRARRDEAAAARAGERHPKASRLTKAEEALT